METSVNNRQLFCDVFLGRLNPEALAIEDVVVFAMFGWVKNSPAMPKGIEPTIAGLKILENDGAVNGE